MKLVPENINEIMGFERGMDPKEVMGLGWKKPRHFPDVKKAMNYVADILPLILGRDKIPLNIIKARLFINARYEPRINDYVDQYLSWDKKSTDSHWQAELFRILRERGFLFESLNFERGTDPQKSLGIGKPTWETLKKGDVIKCIKFVQTSSVWHPSWSEKPVHKGITLYNKPQQNWLGNMFEEGRYYVILSIGPYAYDDKLIEINTRNIKHGNGFASIRAKQGQLARRFEILNRSESDRIRKEYDPYYKTNESQNFERGKDPKEAIGIGLRIYEIDGLGLYDKSTTSFPFTKDIHHQILSEPKNFYDGVTQYIVAVKLGISGREETSYPLRDLARAPKNSSCPIAYDYVKFDGKLYPIPNPNNNISKKGQGA